MDEKLFTDFFETLSDDLLDEKLNLLENLETHCSKEGLTILFITNIIEDIEMIIDLKQKEKPQRYVDAIIRNMSEQVIEYIYTVKESERIEVYFGGNIKTLADENIELLNLKRIIKIFPKIGGDRFKKNRHSTGRAAVSSMAEEIGEEIEEDHKDRIPLYFIFSKKAGKEHNSYFDVFFNQVGEASGEKIAPAKDLDYIYLFNILGAFVQSCSLSIYERRFSHED